MAALILALTVAAQMANMSRIKSDEEVIFIPTAARLSDDGQSWIIPIHGWIFEPERNDLARDYLIAKILDLLPADITEAEQNVLDDRLRWFLVDNEGGKRIGIAIGNNQFVMNDSDNGGHFFGEIRMPVEQVAALAENGRLSFRAVTARWDARKFAGTVHLLPATGLTIVSDIDDTIKISDVTDIEKLIKNTFMRPFAPVEGIAEVYERWSQAGASFHFVSMSPWQLYPALLEFADKAKFPAATYHLQRFRLKDSSFKEIFADPQIAKGAVIEELIASYPQRHFVLVGDTGQKDPELYGALARKYPDRVLRIFLRRVGPQADDTSRFEVSFAGVPREKWQLFDAASELPEKLLAQ